MRRRPVSDGTKCQEVVRSVQKARTRTPRPLRYHSQFEGTHKSWLMLRASELFGQSVMTIGHFPFSRRPTLEKRFVGLPPVGLRSEADVTRKVLDYKLGAPLLTTREIWA